MPIDDSWVMVRWMDTQTAQCELEDRSIDTAFDMACAGYVFVAPSVEVAKQQIVDRIINDDLLLDYGPNDEEIKPDPAKFSWDDEHAGFPVQYALDYDGEIAAAVYIEPIIKFIRG